MNKILLALFALFCLAAQAAEAVPFTNADIEQANEYLKKSEHRNKLCVGGKKIAANDGFMYLAKCRRDDGQYFAVAFMVYPGKEWKIGLVTEITDKD